MGNSLPLRIFYSLNEIEQLWSISRGDLYQWLQQGLLRTHLWMPMLSLYEIEEEQQGNRVVQTKTLCHREGYLKLFPHDCRLLLTEGSVSLREFEGEILGTHYRLPDTTPPCPVRYDDLVILAKERSHFEERYQLTPSAKPSYQPASNDPVLRRSVDRAANSAKFRQIDYKGKLHTFGAIQAKAISILYQATFDQNPWINGKQLLAQAGSLSFSISNLFKRKPNWRDIIHSDGIGNYRLSAEIFEAFNSGLGS